MDEKKPQQNQLFLTFLSFRLLGFFKIVSVIVFHLKIRAKVPHYYLMLV